MILNLLADLRVKISKATMVEVLFRILVFDFRS